jgi:PAS domain S-box-containing protein
MTMPVPSTVVRRYGSAIGLVILAVALTFLIPPLQHRGVFLLFLWTIFISAWYCGWGPALLTIALSSAACAYFLLPPVFSLAIEPRTNLVGFAVFVLFGFFIASFALARRRTENAMKASEAALRGMSDQLEGKVRERTAELVRVNELLRLEIDERKRVEASLRESEARLTEILEKVPIVFYRAAPCGTFGALWISENAQRIAGFPARQFVEDQSLWAARLHPDDRDRVFREFGAIDRTSLLATEYRWQCADGTYRWFLDQASLQRNAQGRPTMIVGTWQDITESKRAQTALFQLSGRILHLQDDERRRIARELHDSTAQDLAALSLNLAILERSASGLAQTSQKALTDSVNLAQHASREIRTLSYLLHPPLLDEAGLASALGWYVDGFVQRSGIHVSLDLAPALGRLPTELETTLFRIVQECLTNILKHSGSRTAGIRVTVDDADVTLEVTDRGRGMPKSLLGTAADYSALGIGIMGMRERVRQLQGDLHIESGTWGTSVMASLPLPVTQG